MTTLEKEFKEMLRKHLSKAGKISAKKRLAGLSAKKRGEYMKRVRKGEKINN
ncbi:hypothetical protein KAR28_06120 [Candidatus Parcubacteria bacterium]|nr:hypothetical protein [Candidatus Parcubacteria bacterium]